MAKGLPKAFKRALWVYHINSGSCNGCDIEIIAALCPRYDAERFGIKLVGSPRHADALLITGPVTRQLADKVKRAYEQMPVPKAVICVGNCGNTGDVFFESYNLPLTTLLPNQTLVQWKPRIHSTFTDSTELALKKANSKLQALTQCKKIEYSPVCLK